MVALAVLAAGCSGAAAGSAATPAPTTLAGYHAQRLDWQPCHGGFECARLLVPFDYARPSWRRFSLSFLGKSYGTYLGTWYAHLFPHRVRALVLDGAVDPDTPSLQDDITQAEGFQVAFRSFAAWCLAAANCPLRGGSGAPWAWRRRPIGGCRGGEAAGPDRSG